MTVSPLALSFKMFLFSGHMPHIVLAEWCFGFSPHLGTKHPVCPRLDLIRRFGALPVE